MEVAALVTERPAFKQELFQESVAHLHAVFRAQDYPGPGGYAREKHPDLRPGDEEYERARNAAYAGCFGGHRDPQGTPLVAPSLA
jgi:hypothetical protein